MSVNHRDFVVKGGYVSKPEKLKSTVDMPVNKIESYVV